MTKKSVTIIGNGISGLFCALKFVEKDYKVRIITKGANFLDKDSNVDFFSSTMNGEAGRFFTTFEGHPYIGNSEMYPKMREAFSKTISKGGWLGKNFLDYEKTENTWLQKRWEANEFDLEFENKFDYYVNANKYSMQIWSDLAKSEKQLFEGTSFHDGYVLRLYNNKYQVDYSIRLHKKYNALKRVLNQKKIIEEYPIFEEGCFNGAVAGGIEVVGQSINIKKFAINLTQYLTKKGVEIIYGKEIIEIEKDKLDKVVFLKSKKQQYTDKNYLFCTGAYHNSVLFNNTPARDKVMGVAGKWFLVPQPKRFTIPTKIHIQNRKVFGDKFPVLDFNFTPYYDTKEGKNYIAIGCGYIFSGLSPFKGIENEMNFAQQINIEALQKVLGSTFKNYFHNGELIISNSVCHRSFSFDDTPIFDVMDTTDKGKLIITGGTNTGTATMSPFIAQNSLNMVEKTYNR